MNIMIKENIKEDNYTYITLATEKKEVFVCVNPNYIQVIYQNAANRAMRGQGKFFNSFNDAIENYKSTDLKAILRTAENIITENNRKNLTIYNN